MEVYRGLQLIWDPVDRGMTIFRLWNERFPSEAATTAREDYLVSQRKTGHWGGYERRCKRTATLIKKCLLQALSSPNPYIREWGKLIRKKDA